MSITAKTLAMHKEAAIAAYKARNPKYADMYFWINKSKLYVNLPPDLQGEFKAESGNGSGGGPKAHKSVVPGSPNVKSTYNRYKDISNYNRGGPLPPGWWAVVRQGEYVSENKSIKKDCCLLVPLGDQEKTYDRDFVDRPFLIHANGGEGSDGCIVLYKQWRLPLFEAVNKAGGAFLFVNWEGYKGQRNDGVVGATARSTA